MILLEALGLARDSGKSPGLWAVDVAGCGTLVRTVEVGEEQAVVVLRAEQERRMCWEPMGISHVFVERGSDMQEGDEAREGEGAHAHWGHHVGVGRGPSVQVWEAAQQQGRALAWPCQETAKRARSVSSHAFPETRGWGVVEEGHFASQLSCISTSYCMNWGRAFS